MRHWSRMNYYELLEVKSDASEAEIRRAFRLQAKKYHPDSNQHATQETVECFKAVVEAYQTLTDPKRRQAYDTMLGLRAPELPAQEYYKKKLEDNFDDPALISRSILNDLLNDRSKNAIRTFDRARYENADFNPANYLSGRDALDCQFLLAEELEKCKRYVEAVRLYEQTYKMQSEGSCRRYLRDEIRDRIRNIYCRKLARRASSPLEAIQMYRALMEIMESNSDKAFILKKIAENYLNAGYPAAARDAMDDAIALQPGMKGVRKIKERLGMT